MWVGMMCKRLINAIVFRYIRAADDIKTLVCSKFCLVIVGLGEREIRNGNRSLA